MAAIAHVLWSHVPQLIFSLFITKLFTGENYAFGKARVVDGDTIVIKKERLRFGGINSPERKEANESGWEIAYDTMEIKI